MVVTIIMTKNCGYDSIKKWLAQQYIGPNGQAYPTLSNDLVEMMNSRNFEPNSFKSRSKRSNRNKNKNKQNKGKKEEIVRAVIEPAPTIPKEEEPNLTEDVPDNDNTESTKDDSEVLSQEDNSSDNDNIYTDLKRVFTMINSEFNEETNMFVTKYYRETARVY